MHTLICTGVERFAVFAPSQQSTIDPGNVTFITDNPWPATRIVSDLNGGWPPSDFDLEHIRSSDLAHN